MLHGPLSIQTFKFSHWPTMHWADGMDCWVPDPWCIDVQNGEKVVYQTSQGEKLLDGEVRVSRQGPCGILCGCCSQVISCSQFEAHAGRGSRRSAPLLETNSIRLQCVYRRSHWQGRSGADTCGSWCFAARTVPCRSGC